MIATGVDAKIQEGEKDVTESFPSTWKDFISHSYWSKVLRRIEVENTKILLQYALKNL